MIAPNSQMTADLVVALLIHYSFDRGGYTAGEIIDHWLNDYPAHWVRLAVVEALYQGRYKAISVEQILAFWNRRGQALYHFNREFERLICGNVFQTLSEQADTRDTPSPQVSESAVYCSNGHDSSDAITIQESAGEQTPVQLVETTANFPPSTNQLSGQPPQTKSYQTRDNHHRSRARKRNYASFLQSSASYPPIEQFTPEKTAGSDFYTKLKAIAQLQQD
jgi:hypothetical protein